jgi:hypothetical protein
MKRISLLLVVAMQVVLSASSQLTVVPGIGVEVSNTRTKINKGSFSNLVPASINKQISIRVDYQFRNSRSGIFGGVSTTNSVLKIRAMDQGIDVTPAGTQARIEFGYQVTTKMEIPSGSWSEKERPVSKKTFVRFQDQFGFAYNPSIRHDIATIEKNGNETYTYYSGNWNLAFIAAWGIEISKGDTKFLNVGLQYLKGLTNLGSRTFGTVPGNQSTAITYKSRTSSWSLNVGCPFTFWKKK